MLINNEAEEDDTWAGQNSVEGNNRVCNRFMIDL